MIQPRWVVVVVVVLVVVVIANMTNLKKNPVINIRAGGVIAFRIPVLLSLYNHADISNYRGITILPIASKVFEHVLKIVFGAFLTTSEMQFGFKKDSSTIYNVTYI